MRRLLYMNKTQHSIRWFVYVPDANGRSAMIPHSSTMRGSWAYDVKCSCGWSTNTGGATRSYLTDEVRWHKIVEEA